MVWPANRTTHCRSRIRSTSRSRGPAAGRPARRRKAGGDASDGLFGWMVGVVSHGRHQEFDIALRPGNRAGNDTFNPPSPSFDPCTRFGTDAGVDLGIANDAALAHFVPSRF